jgi:KaiC/GvpD/RAD55 family RecA-like ATPase
MAQIVKLYPLANTVEELKEYIWTCLKLGMIPEDMLELALNYNRSLSAPLTDSEVRRTVQGLADLCRGRICTGFDLLSLPKTEWLWENFIPRGHVTLLFGEQGVAKSALAQNLAKKLSNGGAWPDGAGIKDRSKTLWLDAEGAKSLVRDRMVKWEMNPEDLIFPMQEDLLADFVITEGSDRLVRGILEEYKPSLVVVDSLSGTHGDDENKAHKIKPTIQKLRHWAATHNVAVLLVHHVSKKHISDTSDRLNVNRVRGSSLIAAQVRSVLALDVVKTADGGTVHRLYQIKNNLGPLVKGDLLFQVRDDGLHFLDPGSVGLKASTPQLNQLEKAQELILDSLANGPVSSKEIQGQEVFENKVGENRR